MGCPVSFKFSKKIFQLDRWTTRKTPPATDTVPFGARSQKLSRELLIPAIKDSKYIEGNEIKSPIVGTFYRKPSPEKEPFVNVGDIVSKGDVLCIIEAMKNMNEIKSDFSGKVVSIEVDDAQPVEFGQTIIIIN